MVGVWRGIWPVLSGRSCKSDHEDLAHTVHTVWDKNDSSDLPDLCYGFYNSCLARVNVR